MMGLGIRQAETITSILNDLRPPASLRVLLVSGIWPPDIGGPASHAPEFGLFLVQRGHQVRAVTTSSNPQELEQCGFPVRASRRGRSRLFRMAGGARMIAGAARWPDVVYSNGLFYKSAVAAAMHGVPLVVKLTTDPAYERARSLGLFGGDVEAFQHDGRSPAIGYLKAIRRTMLSRPVAIVIPSRYLARIARGWGLPAERVIVVANPAPPVGRLAPREDARRRLGVGGPTFVFVGRLVPAKNLPLAISALRHIPAARLVIIGDGPERRPVERRIAEEGLADRVTLMGALGRSEVLEWLRAADAALLSSSWENLPHAAVEALATGTPVVATSVGGVPEVVESGVNGLLVASGDEHALAGAMRAITSDVDLSARLREGALATAKRFDAEHAYAAIERVLLTAAGANGVSGA